MSAISAASLPRLDQFTPQSLGNLAWAYAMLGIWDTTLLKAIASAALPKLKLFSPHDLAYLSWALAQFGLRDLPLIDALSEAVLARISEFSIEDLAKTAWSWSTLGCGATNIVQRCCERALALPPLSSWNAAELLDTAHAFTRSAWMAKRPELAWAIFHAWAGQGMVFDAASFGLLLMDSHFARRDSDEAAIIAVMERSGAFEELRDIFTWCAGAGETPPLEYSMKFDTRKCPGSDHIRGTHAKLALLVADVKVSGAMDAATTIEAVRQHSYQDGQWLKVAGGGKANLIEKALDTRPARRGELALEFGVFVGYTTLRLGERASKDVGTGQLLPLVVGLEVEPVHVCVARWMVDVAGMTPYIEVWAGLAHDLELRVADEFGECCARLAFMDHRGTKFHEDLDRLERCKLLVPGFRIIADNVLKPSAPVFLWLVNRDIGWNAVNYALGEFVQYYVEDWMVMADYCGPTDAGAPRAVVLPQLPAALSRLAWDSDKWRRKSEEDSVRVSEWAAFSRHAREVFMSVGIEAQPWLN